MYRLGQTSSTGVSSSVQESKMSCSSLMSTRSCCLLLSDILPPQSAPTDPNTVPGVCAHCPFLHHQSLSRSLRDTSRWLFGCRLPPKLALCVRWVHSLWLDVELFNVAVTLIGQFSPMAKGPGLSRWGHIREGRDGHTNGDSLEWCQWGLFIYIHAVFGPAL